MTEHAPNKMEPQIPQLSQLNWALNGTANCHQSILCKHNKNASKPSDQNSLEVLSKYLIHHLFLRFI